MVAISPTSLIYETILTIEQVCERFSVSRGTVDNWFDDGLEGFKSKRRKWTTLESVGRFLTPIEHAREEFAAPASTAATREARQAVDEYWKEVRK